MSASTSTSDGQPYHAASQPVGRARYPAGVKLENKALVIDLIEWVAATPRTYAETMDAWRTSCPRLPIWEDALDHGLITRTYGDRGTMVCATPAGLALLSAEGSAAKATAPARSSS